MCASSKKEKGMFHIYFTHGSFPPLPWTKGIWFSFSIILMDSKRALFGEIRLIGRRGAFLFLGKYHSLFGHPIWFWGIQLSFVYLVSSAVLPEKALVYLFAPSKTCPRQLPGGKGLHKFQEGVNSWWLSYTDPLSVSSLTGAVLWWKVPWFRKVRESRL